MILPLQYFEGSYRLFSDSRLLARRDNLCFGGRSGMVPNERVSKLKRRKINTLSLRIMELSFIKKHGIVAIREISEVKNRRANTEFSYTFMGVMSTPIQELSWPVAILVLKKSDQNSVSNILWKSQWLRRFLRIILLKVQLTS